MNSKLIGGVMLVVGTSIGGGMLGLPISTAQGGFLGALLLLLGSWFVMTLGAFLILEVNLWLPENSNLISMAQKTLGKPGEITAWLAYLLLLYNLLAAYTSSGADVFHDLLRLLNINFSEKIDALIFLMLFGSVIYLGINVTDYMNRFLMVLKLGAFIALILLIAPHINFNHLYAFDDRYLIPSLTVVIVSFGFATLVPSLRTYFDSDVKKLRKVILIGSLIPLFCYIAWVAAIFGNLPLDGNSGLIKILASPQPTSALVESIQIHLSNSWVNMAARLFTSVCVATSFLGVSLSLFDFLADGLKLKKEGSQKVLLFFITFLPPFIIALLYPAAFIICLSYGGTLCMILLMILPALMAWRGRYSLKIQNGLFQVPGGKLILLLVIMVGVVTILQEIGSSLYKL